MRKSTRWNRSAPHELDAMVMAPALPYLGDEGVSNRDNNPSPSKAKVDTGESFSESPKRLNFDDAQTLGIWNMFKNCDDPSAVAHTYRNYRDSKYCTVPKEHLRQMRDTMIRDMREHEAQSKRPRKQTQVGNNAPTWNSPQLHIRRGA
jgi:hypothetical protein